MSTYKKGVKKAVYFYLTGTIITLIVHSLEGDYYAHVPLPSFLIGSLFTVIGFGLFLFNVWQMLLGNRNPSNKGELEVHGIVISSFQEMPE